MTKRLLILFFMVVLLTSCFPTPLPQSITKTADTTPVSTSTPTAIKNLPELTPFSSAEEHYGVADTPTKVGEMVADLQGLSLDDFFERSFLYWVSRDPEMMTAFGLSERLGLRNNQLTNISQGYIQETQRLERAIFDILQTYDRNEMTLDQMVNYDIYIWFWNDRIEGHRFQLFMYPVHSYPYTSFENQFVTLMVVYHPVTNRDDVEDYIARLDQIDLKMDDLLRGLELREDLGVIPPRMVLIDAINQTKAYLQLSKPGTSRPEDIILYQSFKSRLALIDTLSQSEKNDYLKQVLTLIKTKFVPSYTKLATYLSDLMEIANDDAGMWKVSKGELYYDYLIRHYTSQDLTAEQVYSLGEIYTAQDQAVLSEFAKKSGLVFTEDQFPEIIDSVLLPSRKLNISSQDNINPLFSVFDEMYTDSKEVVKTTFQTAPNRFLIEELNQTILPYSTTGFYPITDPWFDQTPESFPSSEAITEVSLRTIFYANVIPGINFYQDQLKNQDEFPLFRKYLHFSGYMEGWSCYAPQVMLETGSAPYQSSEILYQLQRDLFLSASMVVDSGIHTKGWSMGEGNHYLEMQVGISRQHVQDNINRYAVMPGQVLAYKVGYKKFMELRDYVEESLGDKFSLVEYHAWLMAQGEMPLIILEDQVKTYVLQKNKTNDSNIIP